MAYSEREREFTFAKNSYVSYLPQQCSSIMKVNSVDNSLQIADGCAMTVGGLDWTRALSHSLDLCEVKQCQSTAQLRQDY